MTAVWETSSRLWAEIVARAPGTSGGVFQTRNQIKGLVPPRMTAAMVKLSSTASRDWRSERFKPSKGASMALSRPVPSVVNRTMSGNLMAV